MSPALTNDPSSRYRWVICGLLFFATTSGMDIKQNWTLLVSIYAIITVLSIAGGWITGRLTYRAKADRFSAFTPQANLLKSGPISHENTRARSPVNGI